MPLVSILMTTYNREKFVAEAIESVLSSSFSDFELIIVDDQSWDNTYNISRKYANKDKRICVYQNNKNLGDYPNRNRAATYARGKYLKYLDSDDKIYYYGLEVMLHAMELFPDAALALSQGHPQGDFPYPYKVTPKDCFKEQFLGRGMLNCGPSGSIIRRDIFNSVKGFRIKRFLGDTELWYRIAMNHPIIKLPPGLVWWRKHDQQEISLGMESLYYLQCGFKLDLETLTNPECPLSPNDISRALTRIKQHHARRILSVAIKNLKILLAYKLYRESKLSLTDLATGLRSYQ